MFPDFLGIGPARTASTWLYENLQAHPAIWMHPEKEVHYFCCKRAISAWRLRDKVCECNIGHVIQDIRYFLAPRNKKWYASQFELGKGKVKGEITPCYAYLSIKKIKYVKEVLADAKLIFVMRDPIERTWSQALFYYSKYLKRSVNSVRQHEWERFVLREVQQRNNYVQLLKNWRMFFPAEQIHIGFYDDIISDPDSFLRNVYRFLKVDDSIQHVPEALRVRVNVGGDYDLPKHLAKHIARLCYAQLEELHEMFGGHTTKWLHHAQTLLL